MKVAVVGLGQIGGSMALRMKKSGIDTELYDINEKIAKLLSGKCEKFNAIGYDLVVFAVHIPVILELIEIYQERISIWTRRRSKSNW